MAPAPSPAQNRVTPFGDVEALPGRGAFMGDRGRLHEGDGSRVVVRRHQTTAWITCALTFRNYVAAQWSSHHYTPLFFLDEAVALAAGHRPCAECRRAAFVAYRDAVSSWDAGGSRRHAPDLDAALRRERALVEGRRPLHRAPWSTLPDGAFVVVGDRAAVVAGDHLTHWDAVTNRYADRGPRPHRGGATVLTPPTSVAALRAGYPVHLDDHAR